MTELPQQPGGERTDAVHRRAAPLMTHTDATSLADLLERVLDKGIVIAGDIQINLLEIELLTIKLRLIIASVDRAREMGIDWWERDPSLSGVGDLRSEDEKRELRERVERLERQLEDGSRPQEGGGGGG